MGRAAGAVQRTQRSRLSRRCVVDRRTAPRRAGGDSRRACLGSRMPKLEVFQSLWAMELRRPDGRERSVEESFEMVAQAGYHGMSVDLASLDVAAARKFKPLFEKHRLGCMINA